MLEAQIKNDEIKKQGSYTQVFKQVQGIKYWSERFIENQERRKNGRGSKCGDLKGIYFHTPIVKVR